MAYGQHRQRASAKWQRGTEADYGRKEATGGYGSRLASSVLWRGGGAMNRGGELRVGGIKMVGLLEARGVGQSSGAREVREKAGGEGQRYGQSSGSAMRGGIAKEKRAQGRSLKREALEETEAGDATAVRIKVGSERGSHRSRWRWRKISRGLGVGWGCNGRSMEVGTAARGEIREERQS